MPFEAYTCYLALKNHFTKDHYDYIKYRGKTRATVKAFYKRRDRFWFEKFSRQKTDKEVEEFFVSNFISCDDLNQAKTECKELMEATEKGITSWNPIL